jgi:hypothetical protein
MKNKWSNIRADALFNKHFLPKKLAHLENNVYFEYLYVCFMNTFAEITLWYCHETYRRKCVSGLRGLQWKTNGAILEAMLSSINIFYQNKLAHLENYIYL